MSSEPTMIERVARAQAEAILGKGVPLDEDDYVRARAAIEEMREPTDAMVNAAIEAGTDPYALDAWQAMINAALTEHANAR